MKGGNTEGGIFEVLKRSVAGTISGICAFTIGHPLDTLRVYIYIYIYIYEAINNLEID